MPLGETIWTGQVVLVAFAGCAVVAFVCIIVQGFRDIRAWERTERYLEGFAARERDRTVRVQLTEADLEEHRKCQV